MIKSTQLLPFVLMCIDFAAAIVYAVDGDVRRVVYWLAAAVLTASVTF
ncbi:MAG: hypothetical protein IKS20_12950 [Victivallales bacterium]|nr:hypothetical protein [Victivallales bacterium]